MVSGVVLVCPLSLIPVIARAGAVMAAKPWTLFFHDAPPQPGDEISGQWSRQQLERMNARFVRAVERAIALGQERRPNGSESFTADAGKCWHGVRRSA